MYQYPLNIDESVTRGIPEDSFAFIKIYTVIILSLLIASVSNPICIDLEIRITRDINLDPIYQIIWNSSSIDYRSFGIKNP